MDTQFSMDDFAVNNKPAHKVLVKQMILDGEELKVHPTAEIFPRIKDVDKDAFDALCNDVLAANRVNESIKIDRDGVLLDGRNRVDVIQALGDGVDFTVEEITVPDKHKWIISTNLHRRHLTTSQRAMIAAELANATPSSGGTKSAAVQGRAAEATETVTQADAAKALNVSPKSVKRATQVLKSGDKEQVAAVKAGTKTVSEAVKEVGKAPPSAAPKPTTPTKPAGQVAKATSKVGQMTQLTAEEVTQAKELISRASQSQLSGLKSYITGVLKTMG